MAPTILPGMSALWASALFANIDATYASLGPRNGVSPGYRSSTSLCPERCSVSGPNTGNWSVYPDFRQIKRCDQTMFYDFSLYDPVDDKSQSHRIHACSSFGPDFSIMPASTLRIATDAEEVAVEFELGWLEEGYGLASAGIRSLVKQMRKYVDAGHGASTDKPFIIYGQSGSATIGIYIGRGLLNQGLTQSALKVFEDNLESLNVSSPTLAMQLCEPEYANTHVFGVIASSDGLFGGIQTAIKSWNNGTCLNFEGSRSFPGTAKFSTPLLDASEGLNATSSSNSTAPSSFNSTLSARSRSHHHRHHHLHTRAECRTVQVDAGNGCADLAVKCGVSAADFTKYNPGSDFCSTLKPKQHVCCSEGTLPDFSPPKNEDGSCFAYTIQANDNCDSLAAEYSLTMDDLEDFNKNTWGWNGCELLFEFTVMCLSEGTPPFPAPIANAVCGPQKPGSEPPDDGSDIAEMNPCPLNACCNIWGQCGITPDFCVDTSTGAPGTAEPGTYGCISNCGMDVVRGTGTGAIKLAYYQGYCFNRDCLYQDASQIDTSKYTHLHYGFGLMNEAYDVSVGDELATYQFEEFKRLPDVKRIVSFGGWAFSTEAATYQIFRNGVKPANRLAMATKIANFIKDNDLDGVDIDWEYPGAPDLPDFDPGTEEDGPNYLAFLVVLKNLLPGKSVAIAAPASFWYLKQFPIDAISRVVDYIVYMTYDLHGQWDAHNPNSQDGCDTGNCLRSQVNLTETRQSLAMITKAGVPGNKIVVGVTSYGRSFKMASADCWGPTCQFTGDRLNSNAKKGRCTGTGGYIADAEIAEILADSSRVNRHFVDSSSNSDVLVYDDTEWVGYMSAATKATRTTLYRAWGLGGTTDWASDLQEWHEAPAPLNDWAAYKRLASTGVDPKTDYTRNGNWTDLDCTHVVSKDKWDYTPTQRWLTLGAPAAWEDIVRIWQTVDEARNGVSFMGSVSTTLRTGSEVECEDILGNCPIANCEAGFNSEESGPAAELIWNSLVKMQQQFKKFRDELYNAATLVSFQLDDMENTFAPVPPEESNMWTYLLIDLLTLGTLGTLGPFFNTMLKKQAHFWQRGMSLENTKDTSMTVVGQGTTIAKDTLPSEDAYWTPEDQDRFSAYMAQVVSGWDETAAMSVEKLFDGTEESLDVMWQAMRNGQLIEGAFETGEPDEQRYNESDHLTGNIEKCIFGWSIPALWRESEAYTFIINAGHNCGEGNKHSDYIDDETAEETGVCVDGKQYYIVYPEGDANECECERVTDLGPCQTICRDQKFSVPPGLDALDGTRFGGISKENLVTGSVNTWVDNGEENGAGSADPEDRMTASNMIDVDVTTAGFMRIPVCSAERAFQSWDTTDKGSSDNYPCDIPPGKNTCEDSSFENQTSDASPLVEDCKTIIRNIQGDGSTDWTTQVVGKPHREIASHGTCAFGVEATKVDGNVNFVVGGQDVIDIINDSIAQFATDGKIGAKGNMNCNGNVKSQPIEWGIY
ncbi:hypothetical protein BDW74DRAFT_171529 [Aspergillus multicolor]|uniref:uncharacterized protein n=1 Tax=Aspergillus multicolor TaxID=41759 RepID=UPI003CCD2850